jgi:hypothetical protein
MISGQPAAGLRRSMALRRALAARDPALFISLHWTDARLQSGTRLSCRGLSEVAWRIRRKLGEPG